MKSPRSTARRALVVLSALLALSVVGVAFASWLATGSGSATARATTAQELTTSTATTAATLYPGATGDAVIRVSNPNPYPVRVTTITGNGAITSDKGAACNAATGVSFSNQSELSLDVAAGASATFTLTGAVSMNNSSHNSCQGAVFTIPVLLEGYSNAS
jgi:hypothetical protein